MAHQNASTIDIYLCMSQLSSPPKSQFKESLKTVPEVRVDYIDLLKGIAILWIIWVHSGVPECAKYGNSIFFFTSGIFFKLTDAKKFFSKRVWMIIIPFLFFYLASIPFRFIVDLWDFRTIEAFDWNRIFDIFRIEDRNDYLSLNVPLWFLLTLFMVQSFSFIVFRLNQWIILALALLSLVFFEELYRIPSLFMINNALAWFGYFAIGYLTGKPLIKYLNSLRRKTFVFILSLLILAGCIIFEQFEIADWHNLIGKTKLIVFIVCFMTFFSFLNGMKSLQFLRFYGKNSLIVLGAHLWILIPLQRITTRFWGPINPIVGLGVSIITAILLVPVIIWMNRYIPFLVGKHKPIKNTVNSASMPKRNLTNKV